MLQENKYVEAKNKLVNNAEIFYKGREGFKNGIFPVYYGNCEDEEDEDEEDKQEEQEEKQEEESEESKFLKYIENKSEGISNIFFNYYFNFNQPSDLAKKLFKIKDKKKNDDFVEEIKNRWSNLKDKTEKTAKDKKENERIEKILEIVKDILNLNKQNQQGEGINEIRQLLHSLYRSKNMTEQVYKYLIGII